MTQLSLDKWDKLLYGLIFILVGSALILFVKRYYKIAVLLLSIVVDILDRII